jgi:hypothetical protein
MRKFLVVLAFLSSAVTHAAVPMTAADEDGPLRCTAAAIGTGGLRTSPVATSLDIVVERWSSESERQRLIGSLKQGEDEILETVRELRRVGYIRTPNSLGWDLHFAQSNPGEDGGRRVVVATDRPMSFWEIANQPRTVDYPFTFIQLQLNGDGEGRGTLSVATKVLSTRDGRFVELETYDAPPVQLNDVKCR